MSEPLETAEEKVVDSRERLARSLDGLRARLTPAGLLDEALGAAEPATRDRFLDDAVAAFRRNPLPLAAAMIAALWFAADIHHQARARSDDAPGRGEDEQD